MRTIIASTTNRNEKQAVLELKRQFCYKNVSAIAFFSSSRYKPDKLIEALNENFSDIPVFGCSTAGEIISGNITTGSIVAMAFTDELIEDIKVEVVGINNFETNFQQAVDSFYNHFGSKLCELNASKYFGLMFSDGLSDYEEKTLDKLKKMTNINFVGGSAGDDFKFIETTIYANGNYYSSGTILAIVKSKVSFGFEIMRNFVPTEHVVRATKVDTANKLIYELNGKPAVETYCRLLDFSITQAKQYYTNYPIAVMIDNIPYARSIRGIEGSALSMYSMIPENEELVILQTTNLIESTQVAIERIKNQHKSISGMLIFSCILLSIELQAKNLVDDYAQLFADIPTVGFCSYGETLNNYLNQIAAVLVLE